MPFSNKRESWCLLVEDNTQEGFVDLTSIIVVLNEAQFPEFIHEKVDSGARRADHVRQRFLRYFGDQSLRLVFLAVTGKQ
jgi:hypothetical protein